MTNHYRPIRKDRQEIEQPQTNQSDGCGWILDGWLTQTNGFSTKPWKDLGHIV